MGLIKNICLRIALTKEQRVVIWNALQYSDYHYRKNSQVDNAVVTTSVLKAVEKAFGVTGKKFSAGEVSEMLNRMVAQAKQKAEKEIADAYQRGRQEGIAELLDNIKHGRGLVVGDIVVMEEDGDEEKKENVSDDENATKPINEDSQRDESSSESTAPTEGETPSTEESQTEEEHKEPNEE